MNFENPFKSFLMGGFECSTHRRGDGRRLDLIATTQHDVYAEQDYRRLAEIGMLTMRDAVRWHLIEREPFKYDFSSIERQIEAAKKVKVQIIWDLFHYGFPDDLDLMSVSFVERFARFANAFTEFLLAKGIEKPMFCLANEISFFSWIAGDIGMWFPFARGRGSEFKRQLVKASLAAAATIKKIAPNAVLIQTDPAINVLPSRGNPAFVEDAKNYHRSQFEAIDLMLGKTEPELGGSNSMIDVIGVNYYWNNQWRHPSGRRVKLGNPDYKPLRQVLKEFYERYRKPIFVAETGIEDEQRPFWFRYICEEVYAAIEMDVPVLGICLYPIVNHPGWDDNRHCYNGLWDYADEFGRREIYEPLAAEVRKQTKIFDVISAKSTNLNY